MTATKHSSKTLSKHWLGDSAGDSRMCYAGDETESKQKVETCRVTPVLGSSDPQDPLYGAFLPPSDASNHTHVSILFYVHA